MNLLNNGGSLGGMAIGLGSLYMHNEFTVIGAIWIAMGVVSTITWAWETWGRDNDQ